MGSIRANATVVVYLFFEQRVLLASTIIAKPSRGDSAWLIYTHVSGKSDPASERRSLVESLR